MGSSTGFGARCAERVRGGALGSGCSISTIFGAGGGPSLTVARTTGAELPQAWMNGIPAKISKRRTGVRLNLIIPAPVIVDVGS